MQFTPPGSPASIQFGSGSTTMTEPHQGLLLVVDDIEAARDDLVSRGVDVGEIWHLEPGKGPVAGRDPERRSYFTRAVFADPDGNQWQLQEVAERLPGRVERTDPAPLAELLAETALHHGAFEADRRAARLVGLVRRLPRRPPGRRHPRRRPTRPPTRYMEEAYGVVVSR